MTPMNTYASIKWIHVACVVASLALFVHRGAKVLRTGAPIASRWLNIVPHLVDTGLLASGVALAFIARVDPYTHPWLSAKIAALAAYVVLGSIAIKRGKTARVRIAAFVAALATYAYIVSVALTKSPLSFLASP